MKKVKYITFPILVMVLTGCGIVPSKAPTFSRYKNEVDHATFVNDYNNLLATTEFNNNDTDFANSNKTETREYYNTIRSSLRRSKKEKGSSEYVYKSSFVMRYDLRNLLSESSEKVESSNEAKFPSQNVDDKSEYTSSISYQLEEDSDNQLTLYVLNNLDKSGISKTIVTSKDIFKEMINVSWISTFCPLFLSNAEQYSAYEEAKYYSDNRVLTVVANLNQKDIPGTGYTADIEEKTKIQIADIDNTHRLSINRKMVYTYNISSNISFKGPHLSGSISMLSNDKYTVETLEYLEYTIKKDKFTLKKKDLSKYNFNEEE